MFGISSKMITKIAIMTVVVAGAAILATAAEARAHHHYHGVASAHRGGAVGVATPPVYVPPPVYAPAPSPPLGFYFYGGRLHDWQTRGLGGYANGLSANGFSDNSVADSRVSTNHAIVSDRISLGSAELVGLQLSARPRRPVIER
jgi:hypothetical protein